MNRGSYQKVFWRAALWRSVIFIFFLSNAQSQINGVLRVHPTNPRYFTDNTGKAILLTGSHTWSTLVDNGNSDPPPQFNYQEYLDSLTTWNHNFFRMWTWEQARWSGESYESNYWFSPSPFARSGPGNALDGKPKFDLDSFNQAYFDTLRDRIIQAGNRGMYVSVMLFNGWSGQTVYVNNARGGLDPYAGHPYNVNNNINGINGDAYPVGDGRTLYTLFNPLVTAKQIAYVKKVIDVVNDLDNVMYEICNESYTDTLSSAPFWQYLMIDTIHAYESRKPKQHPVGMTAQWPDLVQGGFANRKMFESNADWISPDSYYNQLGIPAATGEKVLIFDTDHIWGVGGDREWAWTSFMRGLNPIYMDVFDGKATGCGASDFDSSNIYSIPIMLNLRKNMGYIRTYSLRMNLSMMVPHDELVSTSNTFCLANPSTSGGEYLVFLLWGNSTTVNLSGSSGTMAVEWFNTATGVTVLSTSITAGSSSQNFTSPFGNDAAVLYIYDSLATLPVEITSFKGEPNGSNSVRLDWSTAAETNSHGFYVERRKEGNSNYDALPSGFVEGNGTTNNPHSYNFIDRNVPNGNYFYRLKQTDNDGSWNYSSVANIHIQPMTVTLRQNYPNPFNASTVITFELPRISNISLTVYNSLGQKIKLLKAGRIGAGEHTVHWNGENDGGASVSSGIYLCRLVIDGAVIVRKIMMLR